MMGKKPRKVVGVCGVKFVEEKGREVPLNRERLGSQCESQCVESDNNNNNNNAEEMRRLICRYVGTASFQTSCYLNSGK